MNIEKRFFLMYDRIILKGVLCLIFIEIVMAFLPFIVFFEFIRWLLERDKKNCEMRRQEHEKEMELKQAQIDYYNSHFGKDA